MNDVLIPASIITALQKCYDTTKNRGEAGGLLLGYRKEGAVEIVKATFPMPWDRSTAISFHRSAYGHRVAALREWKRSHRTVDWLGEWHTHPFGIASPSSIDQQTWRRLSLNVKRPMVFLIVAANGLYVGAQNGSIPVSQMIISETSDTNILYSTLGSVTCRGRGSIDKV